RGVHRDSPVTRSPGCSHLVLPPQPPTRPPDTPSRTAGTVAAVATDPLGTSGRGPRRRTASSRHPVGTATDARRCAGSGTSSTSTSATGT
ncbi:hypothetical protein LT493_00980, partial [Streptomyces tricolor]|nr:hypothetical protein [Streptomyces tricolor]